MRYFIGIASKNHIEIGQAGGFANSNIKLSWAKSHRLKNEAKDS